MKNKPMQIKDLRALTPCGDSTLPLPQTASVLQTQALKPYMFNPNGSLNTDMITPFGDLGHINFLKVTEEIFDTTVATQLTDDCNPPREIEGIIQLKKVSVVVVCDYTIVLYNNGETPNPLNSDAILGQSANMIVFDIEGFAFLPVGEDTSKYYNPANYDLCFHPVVTQAFGSSASDLVGVVTKGTIELEMLV